MSGRTQSTSTLPPPSCRFGWLHSTALTAACKAIRNLKTAVTAFVQQELEHWQFTASSACEEGSMCLIMEVAPGVVV